MTNNDRNLAFALARLGLGINFALHGAVRLPKLSSFAAWMTGSFEESWLPAPLVSAFAHALPFVELGLGLLVLLGFLTRISLAGMALVMVALISGSCLIEKWEYVGIQMIYLAFITVMLAVHREHNAFSIDSFKTSQTAK